MLGTYPVMINDVELGALTVRQDGIMTVFEAQCADTGALVRLSVYGEKEGYLGVMLPDGNGKLLLRKRMSRAALADFPTTIQFAGMSGMACEQTQAADTSAQLEVPESCAEEATEPEQPFPASEQQPLPAAEPAKAAQCDLEQPQEASDACQAEPSPEPEPEMQWRRGAGGALIGRQGGVQYLAVPLKSGVAPVGGNFEKRRINQMEYAVFEIKNGKII